MEYKIGINVANIVLWNFFAIIVNVIAFIIIYMKANHNASLKAFFVVQASMIIWLVGKVFKTVSPTVELRWFFVVFYYFGIILLGVSFLDFAYIYYKGRPIKKPIRMLIYVVALLQFGFVVTNPYHHLFYSFFNFIEDDFGEFFYVLVVVNYLYIIIGMVLCGIKFNKQLINLKKLEKNVISFAILIPLVFNFIYISRVLENLFIKIGIGNLIFDITPIIYTWSSLLFVYATFKYEFFILSPMMKYKITSRLDTPILILDSDLEISYKNNEFNNSFNNENEYPFLIKQLDLVSKIENGFVVEYENKYYKYNVSYIKNFSRMRYIIAFTDISSYQYTKNELKKENQELEISNNKLGNQILLLKESSHIGARNYIARELHDILGHSLVVTIKLLEVSKMFYKNNRYRVCDSLKKAHCSIENGFDEMKGIEDKNIHAVYNSTILERELKSMMNLVDISGIKVSLFLKGKNKFIEEKTYDIVKKVITELSTNVLKHSNADKFLISISILNDKITMQVMDNGEGVKKIVKGNGLKGIDGRLSLVGGKAKYSSRKSEGFTSTITIPM